MNDPDRLTIVLAIGALVALAHYRVNVLWNHRRERPGGTRGRRDLSGPNTVPSKSHRGVATVIG